MTSDPVTTSDPTPTSDDGILLTFPKGLLGFEKLKTYRLLEPRDGYPLKFLQSVDAEEVSFTCIDPVVVKRDYEVPLGQEEAQALGLESQADALVLTLVVIPEDPKRMTTNLAGPLVVNVKTRVGFQIVLNTDTYPVHFPIFPQT